LRKAANYRLFTPSSYLEVAKRAALHYFFISQRYPKGRAMMTSVKRLLLTAAAASMVLTPVAAQAKTRAGDSGSIYRVEAAPGLGRDAEGESARRVFRFGPGLFATFVVIGGFVFLFRSSNRDRSPGT
jgi:hypothetical protein